MKDRRNKELRNRVEKLLCSIFKQEKIVLKYILGIIEKKEYRLLMERESKVIASVGNRERIKARQLYRELNETKEYFLDLKNKL